MTLIHGCYYTTDHRSMKPLLTIIGKPKHVIFNFQLYDSNSSSSLTALSVSPLHYMSHNIYILILLQFKYASMLLPVYLLKQFPQDIAFFPLFSRL